MCYRFGLAQVTLPSQRAFLGAWVLLLLLPNLVNAESIVPGVARPWWHVRLTTPYQNASAPPTYPLAQTCKAPNPSSCMPLGDDASSANASSLSSSGHESSALTERTSRLVVATVTSGFGELANEGSHLFVLNSLLTALLFAAYIVPRYIHADGRVGVDTLKHAADVEAGVGRNSKHATEATQLLARSERCLVT